MQEIFDLGEIVDNPAVLILAAIGGGGGIIALLLIGSFFTTGDVSDLVWGLLFLVLQG